mgnify:FL=1
MHDGEREQKGWLLSGLPIKLLELQNEGKTEWRDYQDRKMQNKLRTDKLDGLCQTIRAGRFKGGMAIWIAGDECGSAVLQGQEKEKFPA